MNEKLLTCFLGVLVFTSGCSPKTPPQTNDKTFLNNQILSVMFICGEISDYREKKGCWPDSIECLKDYVSELGEECPAIDWDRYKLQILPDDKEGKVKIEYYAPQISFSIVLTIYSEKNLASSETDLKNQLNEMMSQKEK